MEVDLGQLRMPCSCGRAHSTSVKGIWIEEGASRRLYEMLTEGELREFTAPVIVWDDPTSEAVEEILEDVLEICQEEICLSGAPLRADNRSVEILEETLPEEADLILAVGGGTIHDLSRYIAGERGIPYISVPTAASTDGYLSDRAILTWNGERSLFPAEGPMYVFADTDIFARAPYHLTAAGISEVLGRYICLSDWKIAHLVTGEYFCEEICDQQQRAVRDVVKHLDDIREKDPDSCERLMYALLFSDLCVQMTESLRPAACGEHQVTRLWDLGLIGTPSDLLPGELTGVSTLLLEEYYSEFRQAMKEKRCQVASGTEPLAEVLQEKFGSGSLYDSLLRENTPDPLQEVDPRRLEQLLPEIAEILDEIPSGEKLRDMMEEGGCRQTLGQMDLTGEQVAKTLDLAPYMQRSLSFLRLSKMLKITGE